MVSSITTSRPAHTNALLISRPYNAQTIELVRRCRFRRSINEKRRKGNFFQPEHCKMLANARCSRVKGETRSMVRRLPSRVQSRSANSPVPVGSQTCTWLLAFREFLRVWAARNRYAVSLLQVRARRMREFRPNAVISAVQLVSSLTLTTCWRRKVDSNT